jgi:hypothetical protein
MATLSKIVPRGEVHPQVTGRMAKSCLFESNWVAFIRAQDQVILRNLPAASVPKNNISHNHMGLVIVHWPDTPVMSDLVHHFVLHCFGCTFRKTEPPSYLALQLS